MTTDHITPGSEIGFGAVAISGAQENPEGTSASESSEAALQNWLTNNGATETFDQFRQLATAVFPPDTTFSFALEADPDAEEDSLVCVATLPPGQPVKALAYYNQFVTEWARLSDPRLSGLFTLLVR